MNKNLSGRTLRVLQAPREKVFTELPFWGLFLLWGGGIVNLLNKIINWLYKSLLCKYGIHSPYNIWDENNRILTVDCNYCHKTLR